MMVNTVSYKADIGLIGLAVMGENLVLNMERNGFRVAVFNRSLEKVDNFISGRANGRHILGAHSLEEFVRMLSKPRKVMLMVKAGAPVDAMIIHLLPLLEPGDIIIDGGNSHYRDTERRTRLLESRGLSFIGAGVSGGEEGALKGPSIMPGGSKKSWPELATLFESISAKAPDGSPCCAWIGANGAGHFVKMVHNGIEYADMQLISEAYSLLKNILGLEAEELHDVFARWNKGRLDSYLVELTSRVFLVNDAESGTALIDHILDVADQKGTGRWTVETALELGIPTPMFSEAVFERSMSALKAERVAASKILHGTSASFNGDKVSFISAVEEALYASKIVSYAQGFALLQAASVFYHWELDLGKIALIWRNGCIIRSQFLGYISEAFNSSLSLSNLLTYPYFSESIEKAQTGWRKVICKAIELGIPVPAFSSALSYYDSYRTAVLPANLIQAQRDFFGAHRYERTDREGVFHTDWIAELESSGQLNSDN